MKKTISSKKIKICIDMVYPMHMYSIPTIQEPDSTQMCQQTIPSEF